mgnify:FL=1
MKRILSLDGGGIKGVFSASFLACIEDSINDKVSNYFDLIAGSSTGGIIALGLGLGFSAKEILTFYEKLGPQIFIGNSIFNTIRHLFFSKYTSKELKLALESQFGSKTLGESDKRLVIPAMNLETGEIYIYKTSHNPRFERDHKEKVVDVALATAAAPSYFAPHMSQSGLPLIDGGVWANNPMGMAVVEAIGNLNWPSNSLRVLSIGCTSEALSVGVGRKVGLGVGYWGTKAVEIFMASQSSSSLGTAQVLIGHKNVFRINPIVARGRFALDTIQEIPSLKGLGASEARKALPHICPIFFKTQAKPFKPNHGAD